MKHLSPTLAILALAASVPAIDISGDGLKVSVKGQLQTQLILGASGEVSDGNPASPDDYDIFRNQAGESEGARFNIRRARVAFEAKYGNGWKGLVALRGWENKPGQNAGEAADKAVELYYAVASKSFKTDSIEHEIGMGLDKVFNAESSLSSSAYALPFERPTASNIETRTTGLAYKISSDFINAGVNIANNRATSTAPTNAYSANGFPQGAENGMFYGFRLEFAPGKEFMPKKRQESYLGAEGTHALIGFDYGVQDEVSIASAGTKGVTADASNFIAAAAPKDYKNAGVQSFTYMGPDVIVHWNALTFLAEFKLFNTETDYLPDDAAVGGNTPNTPDSDVDGSAFAFRLAWAIPMDDGQVFEPAIGYAIVDLNKDDDYEGGKAKDLNIADGTNKTSGDTLDIGVNWYFNGNNNKLQLAYRMWEGEEVGKDNKKTSGFDKPTSSGIVLQHQLLF